jgi:2-polyprenyl-6-methoxyphenol hydroxylase-like FAD-dependent oxidoreductase
VERVEQTADRVSAHLAGGERIDADLLIGADGLRSTVRSQFLPELKPYYPGYIAWRCLANESELPASSHAAMFDRYAVCVAPGEQGIAYPVPGPDHRWEAGRRQYNVVWYHPVREADELQRLMTDESGRYHPNGIPPALIRARVREEMVELAARVLAPQFAAAIKRARLVFFQPIVDLESPRLVFGRVVIIGDAAFVARPHVAMGVPKGAGDALALVKALRHGGADFLSALGDFEAERLRISSAIVARGKYLGSYMEAQMGSEEERRQAQELRVPETVMMETAAYVDYDRLSVSSSRPSRS